jgi:hypothetical protein
MCKMPKRRWRHERGGRHALHDDGSLTGDVYAYSYSMVCLMVEYLSAGSCGGSVCECQRDDCFNLWDSNG